MDQIYNLQEFYPPKLVSGEIDPDVVKNIKYRPYPTSSLGVVILDENTDLTDDRKFINLYTGKASWKKIQQVVDTTFSELSTGMIPFGYTITVVQSQADSNNLVENLKNVVRNSVIADATNTV